jgi:serine/threonine-protein kinase RIO1
MRDVEFCKQRLREIAEHGTVTDVQSKVNEFLKARLPSAPAERDALKAWAQNELARLERVPGGGVSKPVPLGELAETGRMMATLQTVISEIETKERAQATIDAAAKVSASLSNC